MAGTKTTDPKPAELPTDFALADGPETYGKRGGNGTVKTYPQFYHDAVEASWNKGGKNSKPKLLDCKTTEFATAAKIALKYLAGKRGLSCKADVTDKNGKVDAKGTHVAFIVRDKREYTKPVQK